MEHNLILKQNCYVQENCKKYNNNSCIEDFCIRLYKMNTLYDKSLLTNDQRLPIKLRLDSNRIDEGAYTKLSSYQSNIVRLVEHGHNLYIYSNTTGNGKTSWALKFIQAYINKVWMSSDLTCRALFINVPRYIMELKNNISDIVQKELYTMHI